MIDLKCGDWLDLMKEIPDNSIDLIVTDPPYRTTSRGCSGTMGGYWKSEKAKKGIIFDYNNISCKDYLPQFYRILKDKTICYIMCNNVNLINIINTGIECGFKFVKCLIWEKGNKICGRYYMGCFEYIILFRKGGDRPINHCGKKVTIKYLYKYDDYYDGGYDESSYVYDVCPECFEQEIKPFLDKRIGNREEEENYYGW